MSDSLRAATTRRRVHLSVWELPSQLLTSVHRFRHRVYRKGKERRHYAAVLAFVYRNRFVTASQVQRRFSKQMPSDRTARRHLAELQESLGYLELIPTPSPLWPKVYSMSRRGLRKLQQSYVAQGRQWEAPTADRKRRNGYSMQHVVHELFITEFLGCVWEVTQGRRDLELLTVQRRALAKHPAFCPRANPETSLMIPDALFVLRQAGRGMMCTFVEIDTGTMSFKKFAAKIHRYESWADSTTGKQFLLNLYRKYGADNPRPLFRVAVVCGGKVGGDDQKRVENLRKVASKMHCSIRTRLWFSSVSDVLMNQGRTPLEASIWRCGVEQTPSWRNQFRAYLASR